MLLHSLQHSQMDMIPSTRSEHKNECTNVTELNAIS